MVERPPELVNLNPDVEGAISENACFDAVKKCSMD